MMLPKCCTQYVNKSGRPSRGHRTGKGQSSSQFPRSLVLKNLLTIGQLHSTPMLVRSCLKSCTLGFRIMQTKNFQMSKLVLDKVEEPETKLPAFAGSQRKQPNSRKISTCFINYAKAFNCVDHNKLWKILKEKGIPDHLTCLLRNLHVGQEATIRTLYGTTDRFRIEKGLHQGCLLSLCLFNLYTEHIMRNARWINYKVEIR